jgi:hypothetical protein
MGVARLLIRFPTPYLIPRWRTRSREMTKNVFVVHS